MDVERMPGNVGGATRVGDTVVRPAGPWTPAVHALLAHLERVGLPGAPRVLGTDGATETLTYLPGRSIDPDGDPASDAELAGAARWLREYHDAVAAFRPAEPMVWRGHPEPVVLGADEIVAHNDPGAYNWIVDDGAFVGMIDWDMAGPGRAIDDLAFLLWSGVPLLRAIPLADAVRRIHLAVAAYDGTAQAGTEHTGAESDPARLLDAVELRMRTAAERIAAGQRRGDPGLLHLGTLGEPQRTLDRLDAFVDRRPELLAALARIDPSAASDPGPSLTA